MTTTTSADVRVSELSAGEGKTRVFVVRALEGGADLGAWLGAHRQLVDERLLSYGSVLFAHFAVPDVSAFDRVVATISEKMGYQNRLSPRSAVGDNIFTATERDARFRVPFHNESSKDVRFPGRIWFYCGQPPLRGGETTFCDDRAVLTRLGAEVVERFIDKGVCYLLTLESGRLDVTSEDVKSKVSFGWQFYFGTDDKRDVERLCAAEGAELEWLPSGGLRMSIRRPAVVQHPVTRDRLWFNHVNVFASTKKLAVVPALPAAGEISGDDRSVVYGDRTPIEPGVLEAIERAYAECELCLPWQQGSVLLLDNFTTAHGRNPFEGERKIYVAMTDAYDTTTNRAHLLP